MPLRSGLAAQYLRLVSDTEDSELKGRRAVPSTAMPRRRWVLGSELADLWEMPGDPAFERDLERMGGEMVDPWTQPELD